MARLRARQEQIGNLEIRKIIDDQAGMAETLKNELEQAKRLLKKEQPDPPDAPHGRSGPLGIPRFPVMARALRRTGGLAGFR